MLTLLFVGAGVYSLTTTGWLNSFRFCCSEPTTHRRDVNVDDDEDTNMEEPTQTRPVIQDRGRAGKALSKAAAI